MGKGMRSDMVRRFKAAECLGQLVVASSDSDRQRLRRAFRRHEVVSPAAGVYARPEYWRQLAKMPRKAHLQLADALQRTHPTWVFCGPTAALIHGLSVSNSLLNEVHVATTAGSRAKGPRGTMRRVVSTAHRDTVDGLVVTSVRDTVCDCLRTCGFGDGLAIVDSALRIYDLHRSDLRGTLAGLHRNTKGLDHALTTLEHADARSESGGESIARATMIEQGFALPELQHEVIDPVEPRHSFRVDFWWKLPDGQCVAGEMDGREKYSNPLMTQGRSAIDVMADERLRESRLTAVGAKVLRFSYSDVLNTPFFVHLLESYGISRDLSAVDHPAPRLTLSEARFLARIRDEGLAWLELYATARTTPE